MTAYLSLKPITLTFLLLDQQREGHLGADVLRGLNQGLAGVQ